MNIIFFGNADFSCTALKYLFNKKVNIQTVITNSDKRIGRGLKYSETPVKTLCKKLNLKFNEIDNFGNDTENYLESFNPDLFVVVAYKILPQKLLDIPRIGSINLHASLLPAYRGASPIQMALINGDSHSGVSTFFLDKYIDTGNIILQSKLKINDKMTYNDLYIELSNLGSRVLFNTIDLIKVNKMDISKLKLIFQNNSNSTLAPKINKDMLLIDWNSAALEIHNKIRALSYIGVYTYYNNKRVKLYDSYYNDQPTNQPLGSFFYNDKKLYISTIKGLLIIKHLKFDGKKMITAQDFYNNSNEKEKFYS